MAIDKEGTSHDCSGFGAQNPPGQRDCRATVEFGIRESAFGTDSDGHHRSIEFRTPWFGQRHVADE